ncbi:cilia- and flagella-associated protein 99 isoform X3 [Coturnix japonica]|uniref:cilia- and flagella-associated protein 99 isoform X3 n=1 Tax=Coturnix japonica TaxID=93934 RepID=UPI0013A5D4FA|nr:cilia- and flagella-associated protein 99 isoform X3 [Coturnix japonica]
MISARAERSLTALLSNGGKQCPPSFLLPGFSMVKMASHGKHITIIIQQLNKFNPENQNMDDFLEESAKMLQTLNVAEDKFVLETLAGCIEYKSLLDVVVNAFFARDGRYCLISERNLYIVICYLATFQLEELGLQHFSRIVKSLDTVKMHKFLRFFFNDLYLNTWIKDEWSQLYDSLYVKENWIDPLLRWQPKVQQLIEQLEDKLSNRTTKVKVSTVTQPKEFNLTVPKPRAILVPLPIPMPEKCPPVPPSTYKPPKEKQQLEKIKTKNRQRAEDLLLKTNTNQFRCAATRPEKSEFELQNTQDSMRSTPAFQTQKIQSKIHNLPIKLNAAAILREGALYQRKMEQELQRIENLLRGTGDASEFLEWQKQMRGKDLEEQQAELECRRLRGKLSYEEAVLAHQNVIQENKKKGDLMREETGGHGLICEMSIVELRERLALLKEVQKAAEEEKRDQIIQDKQAKEQLLLDKLDQISVFRAELGRAAALKQEEKKKKSQSSERQMKDERVLNLQRKIAEKAMERKKQAGLLKITPRKASTASRKDSLQWNRWKELEESRGRRFKSLQYGLMARETAEKMAAYVAAKSGATSCILRSEVK